MTFEVVILIIIVLIILYHIFGLADYNTINFNEHEYHVLNKYPDSSKEAARRLADAHEKIINFLEYERIKYRVGLTDEEIKKLGPGNSEVIAEHSASSIIENMIKSFNPERVYENDPNNLSGSTSYTVQKGKEMYICLRNKDGGFVDQNTLMFVILHEMSHIGAYWTIDHTPDFWRVFAFVLRDAIEAGIYDYVDYSKNPVNYCGIKITVSPYNPAI